MEGKPISALFLACDALERVVTLNGSTPAVIEQMHLLPRLRLLCQQSVLRCDTTGFIPAGTKLLRWSDQIDDSREFVNCCERGVSSLKRLHL